MQINDSIYSITVRYFVINRWRSRHHTTKCSTGTVVVADSIVVVVVDQYKTNMPEIDNTVQAARAHLHFLVFD